MYYYPILFCPSILLSVYTYTKTHAGLISIFFYFVSIYHSSKDINYFVILKTFENLHISHTSSFIVLKTTQKKKDIKSLFFFCSSVAVCYLLLRLFSTTAIYSQCAIRLNAKKRKKNPEPLDDSCFHFILSSADRTSYVYFLRGREHTRKQEDP